MGYIEDTLVPGERVLYRAHLHWKIYLPGLLILLGCLAIGGIAVEGGVHPFLSFIILVFPLVILGAAFLKYLSWEFAVTDKRVLIKTGVITRHTLETLLTKVENIGVEQTVWGRLLNYGTIAVTGTGATKETFSDISAPLEFRKHVQAAAVAFEERGTAAHDLTSGSSTAASQSREMRDCPFCAERILAKAKICRFCGRDVPAAEG